MMRRDLPAYIHLVDHLKSRGHAQTTGAAEKLILQGRVRSGDDILGIGVVIGRPPFVQPRVPATLRDSIEVAPA